MKVMNAVLMTLEEEGDMHLLEIPRRNPAPTVTGQNRGPPHAHVLVDLPIEDENGHSKCQTMTKNPLQTTSLENKLFHAKTLKLILPS